MKLNMRLWCLCALAASTLASGADPLDSRITLVSEDRPLRDVLTQLDQLTELRLRPLWNDDRHFDGLDPDTPIRIDMQDVPLRSVLERLMAEVGDDLLSTCNWQRVRSGEIQLGPTSRLNRFSRVEIYDIRDLTHVVPDFHEVPTIDLQTVLGSNRAGSIFTETNNDSDDTGRIDPATELADLLRNVVESDQWHDHGGDGARLRIHDGLFIINAPGYIHRQLEDVMGRLR